jgi:hypothetical protein
LPNRSTRDENQGTIAGTLHQFAKSLGLASDDPPQPPPPAAPPKPSVAAPAVNALTNRQSAVNKAIDDAS